MNTLVWRLDRFDELVAFGFTDEQAAAVVDSGLVWRPGRFTRGGTGVKAPEHPAKRTHDGPLALGVAAPVPLHSRRAGR